MFTSRMASAGIAVVTVLVAGCSSSPRSGTSGVVAGGVREAKLASSLTFHASFDRGTDADYARGDAWLYHAPGMDKWSEAKPGLPAGGTVKVVPGEGQFGGALRFPEKADPVVFYRAAGNLPWVRSEWGGTVSLWLRADFGELAKGFSDPVQITPRGWNDAAFFVEFEKRAADVPFRLGAYADFRVWNPRNLKWEDIAPADRPLVTVDGPPFSGTRWTHVAFTWERFNTGRPDGQAVLFLDGVQVGVLRGRTQTFTWDPAETRMVLGVGYVGWLDELAVFDRPLAAEEIQAVRRLPRGIASLRR